MNPSSSYLTRVSALVLVVLVLLGTAPTLALAQSVDGADGVGGTIVVEEGETVERVEAFAGNVLIEGTVTGDVSAVGGNVRVEEGGTVRGDVSALAGNLEIAGTVGGDVEAASGNVVVAEGGSIGGEFQAGAGTVTIDGTVDGDATVGAETIRLGETAAVAGDLRYGGTLEGDTGVVEGAVIEDSSVGVNVAPGLEPVASWLIALYALVLNLLLGAALLALFPRFSAAVADRVETDPVRSGLVGLGVLVGVPLLLVAIAITVLGIPIAIVGAFAFAMVVWIGIVYGRFAVAAWLLSKLDADNRWLALVVGLVGGAVLAQIPYLGGLANFLIFLLGLGALSMGVYGHRRRQRESPPAARLDESTAG